jgi:beta-glucanase (GH16 family)
MSFRIQMKVTSRSAEMGLVPKVPMSRPEVHAVFHVLKGPRMTEIVNTPRLSPRRRRLLAIGSAILVVAGASVAGMYRAEAAVPAPPGGLNLVFADDFDGPANSAINTGNWRFDLGHSYPGGAANWGTGEIEEMTNRTANVSLDGNGNLAIKPIRDGAGNWTSARIETQRTDFAAPAGGRMRIEGRLQQPNVSGGAADAYWPAFWAMGEGARPVGATNWPGIGELDIMESINGRDSYFQTLHCGVVSGGPCNELTGLGSGERGCSNCKSVFHTYAVEHDRSVNPEVLRWFVDGQQTFSVSQSQMDSGTWINATRHGFFVILNVAMGGGFPGAFGPGLPSGNTQSGVPMLVDYVAVYQSS